MNLVPSSKRDSGQETYDKLFFSDRICLVAEDSCTDGHLTLSI